MSRTAKLTLLLTSSITAMTVWGVHFLQTSERDAMYQGVIRDQERIRVRLEKEKREAEFEEQKIRREYLENLQPISNPSGPKPDKPQKNRISSLNKDDAGQIAPIKLEGCKTC